MKSSFPPIIAIDAGRSATKVAYTCGTDSGDFIFPSVVTKARLLSNEQTALNAEKDTVKVDGEEYFVGQTAIEQTAGASFVGLNDDWTNQTEYKALVASAMRRVEQRGVKFTAEPLIVVGAPSNVFTAQRKAIAERTQQAVGKFEVMVLPQAGGAYYSYVFDQEGNIRIDQMFENGPASALRNYAVVEVGHFSTDYILFLNSNVNESTFQSTSGVFEAYGELDKLLKEARIKTNASVLNDAFIKGSISYYGKPMDVKDKVKMALLPFVDKVRNKTQSLYSDYEQSLSGILIGGGGAPLVTPDLQRLYPHAHMLENPRMAVAYGFLAFAKARVKNREARKLRAA
jgi:plasmid segregation protein ParM